jgi:hypothetical protein
MIDDPDGHRVAGGSLALGFAALLALLYRDPTAGLAAATVGVQAVVSFVVLPVAGLLAGGYVAVDGPYETGLPFAFGTYLGIVGIGVTVGTLLAPRPSWTFLGFGIVMLGLAVVALATMALRLDSLFGAVRTSVTAE